MLVLWACAASAYAHPDQWWSAVGVLGLCFPFGVAAVVGMGVLCLLFKPKLAWIAAVGLLACCGGVSTVNAAMAAEIGRQLLALCPGCRVTLLPARGLCSYYAQEGGLLVGFEGTPAAQAQAAARAAMLCSVHMAGATA